jgi:RNA polymerase sigma-70 factor (ECF subfamily)
MKDSAVQQAGKMDRAQLREKMESYASPLIGFLTRMLGNADDAREVAQEAFVRALEHIDDYDERYAVSTWLYTIAQRLAINRSKRKRPMAIGLRIADEMKDEPSPAENMEKSEKNHRMKKVVWECVRELPQKNRDAMLLFYRQSQSCDEIAKVLNMPVATVKTHLHRGRKMLREMILEKDPELLTEIYK